jgi:hypothetical protein
MGWWRKDFVDSYLSFKVDPGVKTIAAPSKKIMALTNQILKKTEGE